MRISIKPVFAGVGTRQSIAGAGAYVLTQIGIYTCAAATSWRQGAFINASLSGDGSNWDLLYSYDSSGTSLGHPPTVVICSVASRARINNSSGGALNVSITGVYL